jgi:predicted DNA binding CopG/RHH family protein
LATAAVLDWLSCVIVLEKTKLPYELSTLERPPNQSHEPTGITDMRDEYDFSEGKPNPYARLLKKQITIRIDSPTIDYFKALAEQKGIPYQSLINLYLRDCAERRRELKTAWD